MALKLFRLTLGNIEKFGVAADKEEMHEKRAELEPVFEFTPVQIEELELEGYVIEVHERIEKPPKVTKKAVK